MPVFPGKTGLAEAAVRLKVPYQDAHRLLLTGKLKGEKHGGRWIVTVESLERLLSERDVQVITGHKEQQKRRG